eukprot:scaffold574_cov246-Pinguiococcus_pyrenoidosus.AAC.20
MFFKNADARETLRSARKGWSLDPCAKRYFFELWGAGCGERRPMPAPRPRESLCGGCPGAVVQPSPEHAVAPPVLPGDPSQAGAEADAADPEADAGPSHSGGRPRALRCESPGRGRVLAAPPTLCVVEATVRRRRLPQERLFRQRPARSGRALPSSAAGTEEGATPRRCCLCRKGGGQKDRAVLPGGSP